MKLFTYSHRRTALLKSWCFRSIYLSLLFHPLLHFTHINMSTLDFGWKGSTESIFPVHFAMSACCFCYRAMEITQTKKSDLNKVILGGVQWGCIASFIYTTTAAHRPSSDFCSRIQCRMTRFSPRTLTRTTTPPPPPPTILPELQTRSRWVCLACLMATACIMYTSLCG